eukprot:403332854
MLQIDQDASQYRARNYFSLKNNINPSYKNALSQQLSLSPQKQSLLYTQSLEKTQNQTFDKNSQDSLISPYKLYNLKNLNKLQLEDSFNSLRLNKKFGIKDFDKLDKETIRLIDLKLASMKVPINNLKKGESYISLDKVNNQTNGTHSSKNQKINFSGVTISESRNPNIKEKPQHFYLEDKINLRDERNLQQVKLKTQFQLSSKLNHPILKKYL